MIVEPVLSDALDHMLEGYQIIGPDFRYVYLNAAAVKQSGSTREALIGRTMMESFPGIEQTEMFQRLQTCMTSRISDTMLNEFRYPDGRTGWFDLRFQPLPKGLAVLSIDVTERETRRKAAEKLQARLDQGERLEAIGRLAGGVAHDINNVLTAVYLGLDELESVAASMPAAVEEIGRIRQTAEQGARLTRQLLAVGRRQITRPRLVDVNRIVTDLSTMLGRLIDANIEIRTDLSSAVRAVRIDPGQLEQVLLNLALNARDAMPAGGVLTIGTSNVELDEHYKQIHGSGEPGSYVLLTVGDTGVGIDSATQDRIFEPFFTTKENGQGTGIGLSVVYGVVQQAGGMVWVYSEPGAGTRFKVYLPAAAVAADAAAEPAPRETPRPVPNVCRILVVEDEDGMRRVIGRLLDKHGYQAHLVATLGAARDCWAAEGPFDLVLTDVGLPDGSGIQFALDLNQRAPSLPVVLMSGYAPRAEGAIAQFARPPLMLEKPFTQRELLEVIHQAADCPS